MSLLDRFFKPAKPKSETASVDLSTWRQDLSWKSIELIALYRDGVTADRTALAARMQLFNPGISLMFDEIAVDSTITFSAPDQPIAVGMQLDFDENMASNSFYWKFSFGSHRFELIGIHAPIPANEIEKGLKSSQHNATGKDAMRTHQMHVMCKYAGDDGNAAEQMLLLLEIAHALAPDKLLGVIDDVAWNAIPAAVINQILSPTELAQTRSEPMPLVFWGWLRLGKNSREMWYCSKGLERYGVPNLAFLSHTQDGEKTLAMAVALFNHFRKTGTPLAAGHTAQLGANLTVRFLPVTEFPEFIDPLTTLVVKNQV
jgi:hypothetical protein